MVQFTQYLLPDARKKKVVIDVEPEIETKAIYLESIGAYFEVELLQTRLVSMTCEIDDDVDDPIVLSSKLCINDESVLESVKTLVDEAYNRIKATCGHSETINC